jgi:hypothetical protein
MSTVKRRYTGPLALAAGLAGVLCFELATGPLFVPAEPQAAPTVDLLSDTASVAPAEKPDISNFEEVVSRPLFTQTRRPLAHTSESGAAPPPETLNFDLLGVVISPVGRTALLRPKPSGELLRVVEGQTVAGWEVRAIKPTEIVLGRGKTDASSQVIKINEKRDKSAASAAMNPVVKPAPKPPAQQASPPETPAEEPPAE